MCVCVCFPSTGKEWHQIQCLIKYSSSHQRDFVCLCQSIALRYDIVLLPKTHPQSPLTDWEKKSPNCFLWENTARTDWALFTSPPFALFSFFQGCRRRVRKRGASFKFESGSYNAIKKFVHQGCSWHLKIIRGSVLVLILLRRATL